MKFKINSQNWAVKQALYYAVREWQGLGIPARDEVILAGLIALENGTTLKQQGEYACWISIQAFIESLNKRGLLERAIPILRKNGVVVQQ